MRKHRTGYYLVSQDGWIMAWSKDIDFVRSIQAANYRTAVIMDAGKIMISKKVGSYLGVDQIRHDDIVH